jgi:RNA polymerase sigma-70 factor (ECF subfamily)
VKLQASSYGGQGGTDSAAPGGCVELARRIHSGDARAEAELVERFSRGLRLMLRHLARGAALADDLQQETLSLVIQKLRRGEVRDPERLAGFIRSTARNLFIADRRKQARYVALDGGEEEGEGAAARLPDGGPAAIDRLLADEEARLVRRLLGELRFERDRQVLLRFYLSDDAKEDICGDLGIEPERFNQILHRARERLAELWERAEKKRRLFTSLPQARGARSTRGTREKPGRMGGDGSPDR